jgi:phosphatidylserine synthase
MFDFKKIFSQPALTLRGIVAIIYVCFGIYLFFNLYYLSFVQREFRPFLAGIILIYGVYRLYRFGVEINDPQQ